MFLIRDKIEIVVKEEFNIVLFNLYWNGNDSNGWYSDDEKELGLNFIIVLVSFGVKRYF